MININLLPSAQRPSVVIFDRTLAIGLLLIAGLVLGIIGFSIYENRVISALNDQYADISQKVIVEQQAVKEVDDLRDQATQLQAKAELLERIKQSPLQLAEILTELGNQAPHTVWYTNLNVAHPTGGGNVNIQGKTSTYRDIADLMLNLDGSPIFGDSALQTATLQAQNGHAPRGGVTFTLSGMLNPAVSGQ
jgi:Tfp pilus assembly protein PilN